MSLLSLEDFSEPPGAAPPEPAPPPSEEDEGRLAAYEEGYAAGWEDATTAQTDARAEREAEVARHLQALAFGYHEARQHVMRSMEPLLNGITSTLLPRMAQQTLVPLVVETLLPLAEAAADAPIVLRTAPAAQELLEGMLARACPDLPFQIQPDAALTEGQVMLQTERGECRVDLDAAIAAIARLIDDHFEIQLKERAYAG